MKSLSIIVPAYNESFGLSHTVNAICNSIQGLINDFEILVIEDGSQDDTPEIADNLAKKIAEVKVHHNKVNLGLGASFKVGISLASKEYVTLIPGDNAFEETSLKSIFGAVGKADIINCFTQNSEIRPLSRQIISKTYVTLMNFLFSCRLRYFNGPVVFRTRDITQIEIIDNGFAYMSESLVKLIRRGRSVTEVGLTLQERSFGKSKAFKLVTIARLAKTLFLLFVSERLIDFRKPKAIPLQRVEA